VQNFAELYVSPSEEIFVVFIFVPSHVETTPTPIICMYDVNVFIAHLSFRGSYFRGTRPIREKREILHHAKISRYTVVYSPTIKFDP
jgi:hypothetical protein